MDKLDYNQILTNVEFITSTQFQYLAKHRNTDEIIINKSILKPAYRYVVLATKRSQVYYFYIERKTLKEMNIKEEDYVPRYTY